MTWCKLDDSFWDHPKVIALYDGEHAADAIALWTRCASWSSKHLTEGRIPRGFVRQLPHAVGAAELVRVGLWSETADGYQFNGWLERNPSKAAVEGDRARNAARQAQWRERNAVRNAVTEASLTAPRPDPTRPDLPEEKTKSLLKCEPLTRERVVLEPTSPLRLGMNFMQAIDPSSYWDPGKWRDDLERIGEAPAEQRAVALKAAQASRWVQANSPPPGHFVKYWTRYSRGREAVTQTVRRGPTEVSSAEEFAADARGEPAPWEM